MICRIFKYRFTGDKKTKGSQPTVVCQGVVQYKINEKRSKTNLLFSKSHGGILRKDPHQKSIAKTLASGNLKAAVQNEVSFHELWQTKKPVARGDRLWVIH